MKKSLAIVIASLGLAGLTLGGLAACKQGEGERCQVMEDCEDGLICNMAEQICSKTNTGMVDAPPPPDAAIDAPPDSPSADAMP